LSQIFLDLGFAPPSNAYLTEAQLSVPEVYYPLRVKVCPQCWLVQTEDFAQPSELFSENYAYFSSTSSSWLLHAKVYAEKMIRMLSLGVSHLVIEIACNDGYLLKNFEEAAVPCLGIEPTDSTAAAAERLGIPVLREFFNERLGQSFRLMGKQADLIVANNVYAHVPDINDFTRGIQAALKPEGVVTVEFPHLMRLIQQSQFDTVYHEHFSYLSLYSAQKIFRAAGLRIWDVEELPTHGGSLRLYGCHISSERATSTTVDSILQAEEQSGLRDMQTYLKFQAAADRIKDSLLQFLIEQKRCGRVVGAYGAAAKGNTLLNFAGIKPDLLPFVVDAAPAKQGKFLPGSHIPIVAPAALENFDLDYLLILPWNIAGEIKEQTRALLRRDTRFVTSVPELRIHD
jgi:SAM-dependent methyltransferase